MTIDIGAEQCDGEPTDQMDMTSRNIIPHCCSILKLITWVQNWAK